MAGDFKVVKTISSGVHRPHPLARQAFWRERLAGRRDAVNLNESATGKKIETAAIFINRRCPYFV